MTTAILGLVAAALMPSSLAYAMIYEERGERKYASVAWALGLLALVSAFGAGVAI